MKRIRSGSALVILIGALGLTSLGAAPNAAMAGVPATAAVPDCQATTPRPGSAARRDILNALRPQVEAMAGEDVEFVVQRIRVSCDWARVIADPRAPGGRGNHYETVDVLLQRSNGVWRVRQTACGEEDCAPAAQQYRQAYPSAPAALLF